MYFVYFIKSFSGEQKYIGCTTNLKERIKKHNSGSVRSTKQFKP